jgi:hypothetical protein
MSETPEPPEGWELQQGAGGWRCVEPARQWSTNVYCDDPEKGPGLPQAIEAAERLQVRAEQVLRDQQRLCAELRACFRRGTYELAS